VAHPDANIIFGTVIDDDMGDEVRVTVIAAGFDRWDDKRPARHMSGDAPSRASAVFGEDDGDDDLDLDGDDDFDVPSFLK
jgi:cell division protein FtsZ